MISAYTWRFDSDEPQHLHVIWGWANGLLQYRDVFDNHAPLFHLLLTPVYFLFGERPDILILMRLAVLPLFFLSLWAIYLIGSRLYSRQVGYWAAILVALFPRFFLCSLEFRADDLWMVPWLFSLVLLVSKPLQPRHLFWAGVLLGTTLGISLKTTLLLSGLAIGAPVVAILNHSAIRKQPGKHVCEWLLLPLGMCLVPAALVALFAYEGALASMFDSTVRHNIVPSLGHGGHPLALAILALLTAVGIYWLRRTSAETEMLSRRLLIFLTYCAAMTGLYGFWPLITYQDFLPLIPLIAVFAAALLFQISGKIAYTRLHPNFLPILLSIALLTMLVDKEKPWHPMVTSENRLLEEVVQLTRPGDAIMDVKGETVFRQRPFFYALEGVTRTRIRQGLLDDSIEEAVERTGTTVAVLDTKAFPSHARAFLNQNFVRIGDLRVAGQRLTVQSGQSGEDILFSIRIPSRYMLVAEKGNVAGTLDGSPYIGSRWLDAGRHVLRLSQPLNSPLAVIWAPAVERGFSPFAS